MSERKPTFEPPPFKRSPGKNCRHRYNVKCAVWRKTGGICAYCATPLDYVYDFHMDHIVPKSFGGPWKVDNMLPACQRCNSARSNMPIEWFVPPRRNAA